jgi:uncharacterized membrane protein YsdA (DUF1294 family)/cold shock CspA family protein
VDHVASDGGVDRQRGVLTQWNDDRGFGFITPAAGGSRVFAHVSAFPRGQRPSAGREVTYAERRDEHNRPRASEVRYAGAAVRVPYSGAGPARRPSDRGLRLAVAAVGIFLTLLVVLLALGALPPVAVAGYAVLSGVAFLMYRADKSAAQQGRWRTSESTLHTVAVLGGWPGALVAQQVFRHKTVKQPFRSIFWVTVGVNCAALAWFVFATPLSVA